MDKHCLVRISDWAKPAEAISTKLEEPRKYWIILLNDDYTPMDFVVEVLQRFFGMTEALATQVMLQIHRQGKAICGKFTRDVADTKVAQVNDYARVNEHPLLSCIEPE